jgi:hypothetical protein
MTLKERVEGFASLGAFIRRHYSAERIPEEAVLHAGLDELVTQAGIHNNWFIPAFVNEAVGALGKMLNPEDLTKFASGLPEVESPKTVAVICAGNIPLVGFHDLMCVLLSGNYLLAKLSSDDNVLPPFFLRLLTHYQPLFTERIRYAEGRISSFEAVIASGSDNTARYLGHYFGKYPHIIRKSRTSLAILSGNETEAELKTLGRDIFLYFGLGCRSVSKLMVPAGYNFGSFFRAITDYGFVVNNKKYGNNYDYNRAIFLLEKVAFLDNNFLMIRESRELFSPVAVLHYEFYASEGEVASAIDSSAARIQCVVGRDHTPFGYSQHPVISEFADKVDTLRFLVNL